MVSSNSPLCDCSSNRSRIIVYCCRSRADGVYLMNDILRNSILKLSDTRRIVLIDKAAHGEWNKNALLAQILQTEGEIGAIEQDLVQIEKELHRLTIIDNELEGI